MICKEVECALQQNDAAKFTNIEALSNDKKLFLTF